MHLIYADITVYKPVLGPKYIKSYLTKITNWTIVYIFRMHLQIPKSFVAYM
jgi:hypothetical protein